MAIPGTAAWHNELYRFLHPEQIKPGISDSRPWDGSDPYGHKAQRAAQEDYNKKYPNGPYSTLSKGSVEPKSKGSNYNP